MAGRNFKRLTSRTVDAAKPGKYADGGGLYLIVADSGSRKWVLRFTRDGKAREMGLGAASGGTLADARHKAAEAQRLLALVSPQVVILDVKLPDGSGVDVARAARAAAPDLGIVMLTMYAGDEQLFAALEAGASAFVPKNAPPNHGIVRGRVGRFVGVGGGVGRLVGARSFPVRGIAG